MNQHVGSSCRIAAPPLRYGNLGLYEDSHQSRLASLSVFVNKLHVMNTMLSKNVFILCILLFQA